MWFVMEDLSMGTCVSWWVRSTAGIDSILSDMCDIVPNRLISF